MFYPTFQQMERFVAEGYNFIPIGIKQKITSFEPIKLYEKVKEGAEAHFIFESGKIGLYTYLAANPLLIVKGKNGNVTSQDRSGESIEHTGNPLVILMEIMAKYQAPAIPELPKFYGGAVGYLSYDMARYFERLPNMADDDLSIPDLYFMLIDKLWVYDQHEEELYYIEHLQVNSTNQLKVEFQNKLHNIQEVWNKTLKEVNWQASVQEEITENQPQQINRADIATSFTRDEFIQAVEKIQEYIAAGDVFQVNLSVRQSRTLKTDSLNIYQHLRKINPSPYMGYLHFAELQLVSSSPELLIEVNYGKIQTRPIAGTRPRGLSEEEDQKNITELLNNEKEVAEHIMLVDLERNDLGRVSKYGTVEVNELMAIEKYSHVIHIVSNVVGELAPGKDLYDCIKATFPGGTITGAPKIRTMEIIEELEPVRRGPYTGSMGWISFQGNLELNILIRTMIVKEGKGYLQAGAGVVIDSIPENEFIESLNKAEAIWRAVESSEQANKGEQTS